MKRGDGISAVETGGRAPSESRKRAWRIALVVLAAAMTAAGAGMGQARDVWRKAVRVCLECIGLG